ncbi:MAG: response regulator [Chthoniobacterales bacterium]
MKLLVADDQGPVGEIISRIAEQSGWEAIHTTSTDDLTSKVISENVSVLLIDYALDGNPHSTRNGLTVTAELRAADIDIPVILFSGWPNMIDSKRAAELDVIKVLEKPLSIQDLQTALNEAKAKATANA